MNRGEPLISVENVSFLYNGVEVLRDVSFAITRGDYTALIGPNGSGKTTLIRIILGIQKPSAGRVLLMGEEPERFAQWRRIGYVPQKATHRDPYFPASVREVVAMGLLSRKRFPRVLTGDDKGAIDSALRQVDMQPLKNRRIGELSGGQQQRVFIARAIVNGPDILFLDEPTTGVDAETQSRFYEMLGALNREKGITIVLITHDFGIINGHVSKVACLNQRLHFHGTHEEFCASSFFREMVQGEDHLVAHRH
ncbi:MAG TPA: metal ABC transporter ATP-binding protein [Thermodesulfobacteriota bacterium]|nr:metal ABC transporter ATP-binding protein [Thermodesulfobacteriota bacterium]